MPSQPTSQSTFEPVRQPPSQIDSNLATPRKKRGPKPKPLSERKPRRLTHINRKECTYSRQRKIDVLLFLEQHVHDPRKPRSVRKSDYRLPTLKEAADFFQIPKATIHEWVRKKKDIVEGKAPVFKPHAPELEKGLS